MQTNPKYRRLLNAVQLHTLKLLYKFRFVTAPLLALVFKKRKSISSVYQTLTILVAQDYVGKQYDSSFRIIGKQARYYLRPKAIRLLLGEDQLNAKSLENMYRNGLISPTFVDHHLEVLKAYLSLEHHYPNAFRIFAKSELTGRDDLPAPAPDLYLSRKEPGQSRYDRFMLDICTHTQYFIVKRRVEAYIEHYEADEREGSDYPTVLVVASDSRMEKRLQTHIARRLDHEGLDGELTVYTTTPKTLIGAQSHEAAIWSDVLEPEVLVSLDKCRPVA